MSFDHRFNTIGDQFAGRQAVFHSGMSHRNAVIDCDGIKFEWYTASCADGFLHKFPKCLQVHVAWHDINVGICNGNKWFAEICFFYA